MRKRKNVNYINNYKFIDSALMNDLTYMDYLQRFERLARSIFEWVNLPSSMNADWLERSLYFNGMATILEDDKYGIINTNCSSSGEINIYGLPSVLNCFAFEYQEMRRLYTGLKQTTFSQKLTDKDCILVMNNVDRLPTCNSMELFALRLYEADRTCDVNIKSQKTPILLLCDERQRQTLINLYNEYNGNQPFIFGNKANLSEINLEAIQTNAPYVADKIMDYKKEIWNEALTFLGINNIMIDKKERLVSDEANSNNELINLNLQSFLAPRQYACKQFNEKFGYEGTNKEISVRVRSDLHNIIKNTKSIVTDYQEPEIKEGEQNG